LTELGYQPHVSGSNFVLFGGVEDPQEMFEALLADGVLIRDVGIPGHLRVSAGTAAETSAFLDAVARYRHDAPGDSGAISDSAISDSAISGSAGRASAGGGNAGELSAAPVGL
jgi:hypothetical protein